MPLPHLRPLLVWSATTVLALLVGHWGLDAPAGPTDTSTLLVRVCGWSLAACAGWCWLVTTAVVVDACRDRPHARVSGVPPWARRAVLAACGLALLPVAPTHADSARPHGPVSSDPVVAGLRLPDRVEGPASAPGATVGRAGAALGSGLPPAPGTELRTASRTVVIRPGDSLWSLAADLAESHAGAAVVLALTEDLYRINRTTVGADPDLLLPGQQLRLPALPQPHRH